jgi:hypothetical protein
MKLRYFPEPREGEEGVHESRSKKEKMLERGFYSDFSCQIERGEREWMD